MPKRIGSHFLILLLLNIFCLSIGYGQPPVNPSLVRYDTSDIQVRKPTGEKIEKFRHDSRFDYLENAPVNESLWGRILNWFLEFLNEIFYGTSIQTIVFYVVLFFLIILLLFRLFNIKVRSLFYSNNKQEVNFSEIEENIEDMNLDKLINVQITNKNYRAAVRFMYLKTIKILNETGKIIWKKDKTNDKYISDLAETIYVERFKDLTLKYECTWYGRFHIEESNFNKIDNEFRNFYKMIND